MGYSEGCIVIASFNFQLTLVRICLTICTTNWTVGSLTCIWTWKICNTLIITRDNYYYCIIYAQITVQNSNRKWHIKQAYTSWECKTSIFGAANHTGLNEKWRKQSGLKQNSINCLTRMEDLESKAFTWLKQDQTWHSSLNEVISGSRPTNKTLYQYNPADDHRMESQL